MALSSSSQVHLRNNKRLRSINSKFNKNAGRTAYYDTPSSSKQYMDIGRSKKTPLIAKQAVIEWLIILGVAIVIFLISMPFLSKKTSYIAQPICKAISTKPTIKSEKVGSYKYFIENGNSFLNRDQFHLAENYFSAALRLFPKGKEANIAYTQYLANICAKQQLYCNEKSIYLDKLVQSDILTFAEKRDLLNNLQ